MIYMSTIKFTLLILCHRPYTVTRQVRDSLRTKMCKCLGGSIKTLYTAVVGREPNVVVYAFYHIRDIVCCDRILIVGIMGKIRKYTFLNIKYIESVSSRTDVYMTIII